MSPSGDLYISDGYGNSRVHKYDPSGKLLFSWGSPGTLPGEFNIAHNICCDADGWVYVADRENHRVQVFDGNGKYETQWNNLHRPSGLFMSRGECPLCFIGEIGPHLPVNLDLPNIGPRLSILDLKGNLIARVQADPARGGGPGQFISPHGLAVDSHGDIYVGEVAFKPPGYGPFRMHRLPETYSLPAKTGQGRGMSFTIGIDVGGTFTDIVVAGSDGRTIIAKATTTPADQSDGVLDGIGLAARQSLAWRRRHLLAADVSHRARNDCRYQRVAGR